MDKRLLGKKVIVTGGSRGIGAGIVERLFNEGAEIIIADIKKDLAKLDKSLNIPITTSFYTKTNPFWVDHFRKKKQKRQTNKEKKYVRRTRQKRKT